MYKLFYCPSTASMVPHILLREIGAPHELMLVDTAQGNQRRPEYLALNPNGRVPTLVDGDLVLYETAAICLHLCDRHPESGLAPPVGSAERGQFYTWLVWLTNTLHTELMHFIYAQRYVEGAAAVADYRVASLARLAALFAQADAALEGREFLVGERFSAADAYLFTLSRWTRNFPQKARDLPNLGPYLARILARPAVKAMFEAEGLGEPYY